MPQTVITEASTAPFVVAFADGDMSMSELMGGKGANLAEMTRIGLPVPHGFTITTAACRHYLASPKTWTIRSASISLSWRA
jgi:phosphoenolpyruvate synthase/pyruvate phosphate dikinase